jgi:hypothetical protein
MEMERRWFILYRHYSGIYIKGLRKNTKCFTVAVIMARIVLGYLTSASKPIAMCTTKSKCSVNHTLPSYTSLVEFFRFV